MNKELDAFGVEFLYCLNNHNKIFDYNVAFKRKKKEVLK